MFQFASEERVPDIHWVGGRVVLTVDDDYYTMSMGRLCLRTAATNGPTVYPAGDIWA
jgi:hypothetical protein